MVRTALRSARTSPARRSVSPRDGMKILVATDGSRGGKAAVGFAAGLVRKLRSARVDILVVGTLRRDSVLGVSGAPFPVIVLPDLEKRERRAAESILARAGHRISGPRVVVRLRFLAPRDLAPVARVVAREAERLRADLVIVGSQGRSALPGLVLGSVALKLMHSCPCPVAVVHPRRPGR